MKKTLTAIAYATAFTAVFATRASIVTAMILAALRLG
jgi:hypothetical protein